MTMHEKILYIKSHSESKLEVYHVSDLIYKKKLLKELISTSVKINKKSKLTKPTFPDSFKQYKI